MQNSKTLPIDIHPLIARGLLWDNTPLSRAVFYDAEGNIVADAALPPVTALAEAEKDWANTPAGYMILLNLAEYGLPMSAPQIAAVTKYSYSGSFRETLNGLVDQKKLTKTPDKLYRLASSGQ